MDSEMVPCASVSGSLSHDSPPSDTLKSFDIVVEADSESEEEEADDSDDDSDSDYYLDVDHVYDDLPPVEILCKDSLYHSDDDADWPDEMTPEEFHDYFDQLDRTAGFEIQLFRNKAARKHGVIQPALTSGEYLHRIIYCAKLAVKLENKRRRQYNEEHDRKLSELRLIEIRKAMSQESYLCPWLAYFITIKVEEREDDGIVEKIYETLIRLMTPPKRTEFVLFRPEDSS